MTAKIHGVLDLGFSLHLVDTREVFDPENPQFLPQKVSLGDSQEPVETDDGLAVFVDEDGECFAFREGQEIPLEVNYKAIVREKGPDADTLAFRAEAERQYSISGEVTFDHDAVVSRSDDGAYVQAWCWVSNSEAGIETNDNTES